MKSDVDELPGEKFEARVGTCLIATGADFVSIPVETLLVDFAGIVGDHHARLIRPSTSREPWYPRGTEIRNNRQLSIVSSLEMAEVAAAMELPEIEPGWIGANLVFGDIPNLTHLPAGTKLLFAGGASPNIELENGPCRISGRSIADHFPEREGLDLLFPTAAVHKRGVVASVEKPGTIQTGETVTVLVPLQRLFRRNTASA